LPENTNGDEQSRSQVKRLNGQLHSVHTIADQAGNVVQQIVTPLMVEFQLRDVLQILIGACVLCIPVAFTEEVWNLGATLPLGNTIGIVALSLLFLGFSAYFIFARGHFRGNEWDFVKRLACGYLITFSVSLLMLFLIQKLPLVSDPSTALTRSVLVTFPGCFSATVVDSLR
jgi:uncharacterized membrane protein